jgi:hypothetical protein
MKTKKPWALYNKILKLIPKIKMMMPIIITNNDIIKNIFLDNLEYEFAPFPNKISPANAIVFIEK